MTEKNVIIVPRKYTVGKCCGWGYRSGCGLGWIGPCSHKVCPNTLCVKAKKEKSVFYPKYCPGATCIIKMTCERCEQPSRKIILKKDWVKKTTPKPWTLFTFVKIASKSLRRQRQQWGGGGRWQRWMWRPLYRIKKHFVVFQRKNRVIFESKNILSLVQKIQFWWLFSSRSEKL